MDRLSIHRDCESISHGLHESAGLSVMREQCLRQARTRSGDEQQECHVLIFPLSGVNVMHVGDESFVVDPSQVTLSNAGDVYRVSHPEGSGEITIQLAIETQTLLGVLESQNPDLPTSECRPFARGQVRRPADLHLQLVELTRACTAEIPDAVEIEESVLGLVDSVAAKLAELARMPRYPTSRDDRELADAAATLLAARYAESLSLEQISAELGVTKFRLCRIFKRVQGETLWQRIHQLRARHAAVALASDVTDLSALALDLGFASHSHFAASFRRVFGTTPSAARQRSRS